MSYCDDCKIEVEQQLKYCPLCDNCVNPNAINQSVGFPTDQAWKRSQRLAIRAAQWILLLAVVAGGIADLVFFKRPLLVLHILFPSLLVYGAILLPIKNKWSFSNQNNVLLVLLVAYLAWLESFVLVKGWALAFVIPIVLLASSVYNFFVIFLRKYNRFEHLMILITSAVIAIAIFIANLVNGFVTWPIIAAFATSVALLVSVILLKRKNVTNELAKKFHI